MALPCTNSSSSGTTVREDGAITKAIMAITSMETEAEVATTTMVVAAVEAMATVADDGKFSSQIERRGF